MVYIPTTWEDGKTPVNAANLNKMERGIEEASLAKAIPGPAGPAGYTPVKGIDYWTEADKAEIKSYVDEAIRGISGGGGSGGSGGMVMSAALLGPGYTVIDGISLSVEIPDETEETTE